MRKKKSDKIFYYLMNIVSVVEMIIGWKIRIIKGHYHALNPGLNSRKSIEMGVGKGACWQKILM
jgi:hypothetical protein